MVNLETLYISYFKFDFLYNMKIIATSMLGYKHTDEAKQKMRDWFKKYKHPQLGKERNISTKEKISLAVKGINNPMYGRRHSDETKKLISLKNSKPVYLYKLSEGKLKLVEIYLNSVEVGKLMNLHKSTIGKYIKKETLIMWKSHRCLLTRTLLTNKMLDVLYQKIKNENKK